MYILYMNWQLGDWFFLLFGFDVMEYVVVVGEEGVLLDQYFNGCVFVGCGSFLDFDNY